MLLLAVGILCLTATGQVLTDLLLGLRAQSVLVQIPGLPAAVACEAAVARVSPTGAVVEVPWTLAGDHAEWRSIGNWTRSVRVTLPKRRLDTIDGVGIRIGLREFWFARAALREQWTAVDTGAVSLLPPGEPLATLESPAPRIEGMTLRRFALNWPETDGLLEDFGLLGASLWWPLQVTAVILALMLAVRYVWPRQAWLRTALAGDDDAEKPGGGLHRETAWFLAGLAVLLAVLVRLQLADPYWFTQDDNRAQFLPTFLFGCRSAFEGLLPAWNPHEHLGAPMLDCGHYPFTYPLTYACYWIARSVLGEPCQTMQVWAWLHLLLGYFAAYGFARAIRMRPALAASASIGFVLSGFFLILGRAWPGVPPLTVFLPLTMLPFVLLDRRAPGRGWVAITGAVVGLSFHTAYAQFWAYSMIFFFFAALLQAAASRVPMRRLLWIAPGVLLGVAVAAPLLVPQLMWVGQLHRAGGAGFSILTHLPRLVLPSPLVDWIHTDTMSTASTSTTAKKYLGHLFYSGTVLTAAGLAAMALLFGAAASSSEGRRLLGRNVWLVCAALAFLLALGNDGFLWTPVASLPAFSMFNHPVKLLPYLTFFLLMGGGLCVERLLDRYAKSARPERMLAAAMGLLMLYHASPLLPCFTKWPFPVPYPPLPGIVGPPGVELSGRFVPLAQSWIHKEGNLHSLSFSLPTYYDVLSMDGYNPLVWASPENVRAARRFREDPIATARAYGVRWFLQRKGYAPPPGPLDLADALDMSTSKLDTPGLLELVQKNASLIAQPSEVAIWKLSGACPLAFSTSEPSRPLPVAFDSEGVRVDTTSIPAGARVVVNVLFRPRMFATAGGRPLPIRSDRWDRVEVDVPPSTARLEIRYRPALALGFLVGVLLSALAFAVVRLLESRFPAQDP